MINNKIIENELNDLERELANLLARISELKNEVHKMNIKVNNKTIYEQYVSEINGEEYYTFKNRGDEDLEIINLVGHPVFTKYSYRNYNKSMVILSGTKKIIETYIPSKNICLVVEL